MVDLFIPMPFNIPICLLLVSALINITIKSAIAATTISIAPKKLPKNPNKFLRFITKAGVPSSKVCILA